MKTLVAACSFEETIRKSRFIAQASPVASQADTLSFYESVADPQANHNCWAWRVEHVYRFNDDGEPPGSAGRPILAAIEGRELDRVMIVVTRYFGGIKLGIGGLVRAYGGCAAKCLDRAEISEWQPRVTLSLHFDFALSSAIHGLLEQHGAEKLGEEFGAQGVRLGIEIDANKVAALNAAIAGVSRGQAELSRPAPAP